MSCASCQTPREKALFASVAARLFVSFSTARNRKILPSGPEKSSSGHQVKVQVVYALPRAFAIVSDQAKVLEVKLVGQFLGYQKKMPQQGGILFVRFGQARDVLARDD